MNLEDQADRDRALTVPCPDCHAQPGEPCMRADGEPLARFPAHVFRLHAAGVAHAPLDSRELRRG